MGRSRPTVLISAWVVLAPSLCVSLFLMYRLLNPGPDLDASAVLLVAAPWWVVTAVLIGFTVRLHRGTL